ncbi:MAG TPA: hypothetical protein ENF81_10135 [Thermotogaceae bacterium]|nr:hypothetical protein [Thermotogaceae bacterium]
MWKKFFLLLLLSIILTFTCLYSQNPLLEIKKFKYLDYKINYEDKIFYYKISVDKKGDKYEITTATRFSIPEGEELTLDNIAQSTYAGLIVYFFNPAYEEFLNLVDIQNPKTLEMYGIKIKYEGSEKVGKYWGEKFTLITNDQPQITWIISKTLKMILKIEIPQNNTSMELVDFKRR